MHYKYNTEKLLGLQGVIVKNVIQREKTTEIYLETESTEQVCPCCKSKTKKIHDYRFQRIKDIPTFGKYTYLILKKRRYLCVNCKKRFYEKYSFLPKYYHQTNRLSFYVLEKLKEVVSFTSVARELNLSISTVIRIFDIVQYTKPSLNKVLAIDEFKGNADGEKYLAIITDPENKLVLDILPKRHENYLINYFKHTNREDVEFFVSDMWKPYKHLCETFFSNSTYITDRYHFVRQMIWAFEKVRKSEQNRLGKTYRQSFKRSKSLLITPFEKLSLEDRQAVKVILRISPKLSEAHYLKEEFFELLKEDDFEISKKLLSDWIKIAEEFDLPEFIACTTAFRNWYKSICHSFEHRYSNGFTEGCNNKIKVLKRTGYGYRNFKRFRNRILHIFNDKNIINTKIVAA